MTRSPQEIFHHPNKCAPAGGFQADGSSLNLLREDLMLPAAVVKQSAILNNSEWMREFVEKSGVSFAPHGKTTMSPQLFKIQMEHGAWGLTLANAFQVRTAREAGIDRILLANQLVGKQSISYILKELNEHPEFEFYCLVDNVDNVAELSGSVQQFGGERPLNLLIEIGPKGGRTGVRDDSEAIKLAERIRELGPSLRLCGIECYEGVIHGENAASEVEAFLHSVNAIASEIDSRGLFDTETVLLSGGGTAFFDLVVKIFKQVSLASPFEIVIRPGCYIAHDGGIYETMQQALVARDEVAQSIDRSLRPAIEILSYVQSLPEPGMAILGMGKRDVSFDSGLPIPKMLYKPETKESQTLGKEFELYDLNDQHAFLRYPKELKLKVGDIVVSDISHPCLAFDKWQLIPVVDDDYTVTDYLNTCF